jgi:hypothetical protein
MVGRQTRLYIYIASHINKSPSRGQERGSSFLWGIIIFAQQKRGLESFAGLRDKLKLAISTDLLGFNSFPPTYKGPTRQLKQIIHTSEVYANSNRSTNNIIKKETYILPEKTACIGLLVGPYA